MADSFALGEEIAALATQVNCATHALLTRIRRFDQAEGWGEQGAKTCAHWLTWRIGLDPATAREKVRVARALGTLSKLDQAFADGKLSYAKVRALTRVTTPETEDNALLVATAATGAQLERICRRLRHASDTEKELASERRFRGRVLGDGLVRLEIVVTSDEADLVVQAVERAQTQMAGSATPRPTAADGLMEVIGSYVAGRGDGEGATAASAEIVVHLEPAPTAAEPTLHANLEDGTPVSAETLRRVSCDSGLVAASLAEDGTVLDIGRRTRSIPTAIRRALWIRDRGCRFPGCASTRFLHGHHIHHWLHGGRTSLDNLLFLCTFHHRLVHEGGFTIAMNAHAEVIVTAPSGRNVSAETPPDIVDWTQSVWDDPGIPTMAPPDWDGDPFNDDDAVDGLWPATSSPADTPASAS